MKLTEWGEALENFRAGAAKGNQASYFSVRGNMKAARFRAFVGAHVVGTVLDVGCGQQFKPVYLEGIPDDKITGIDPLPGEHPFTFIRGQIEDYTGTHDTVICGTSMDHLRDLETAAAAMKRAAREKLIIWCSDGTAIPKNQHTFVVTHETLFGLFGVPVVREGNFFVFAP